jgi:hypothetical protein
MAGPGSTRIPARDGDTTSGAAVHILLDDGDGLWGLSQFGSISHGRATAGNPPICTSGLPHTGRPRFSPSVEASYSQPKKCSTSSRWFEQFLVQYCPRSGAFPDQRRDKPLQHPFCGP